ncbi:hypothetical protein [Dongia rigui]|uniref:Uncharacterized protein n=1 Tax=Dongia rigui TaxID=940149 RepID=A0ABU5E1K5_9PROT|nr:hypothetical protein [Dongia rigui]MDY0873109.1 hypothetical protein [Dongia rigui]
MVKKTTFDPEEFGRKVGEHLKATMAETTAALRERLAVAEHRIAELEVASKAAKPGGE